MSDIHTGMIKKAAALLMFLLAISFLFSSERKLEKERLIMSGAYRESVLYE